MSREFGESGCGGFFHQKIQYALEDAQSGSTSGAKIMASILSPLADIAYAVSSEEACDSSEESTVHALVEARQAIYSALIGIDAYIRPAKQLAFIAVSNAIEPFVKITEIGPNAFDVSVPSLARGQWDGEARQEACRILLSRKHPRKSFYWRGSTGGSSIDGEVFHFSAWGESEVTMDWMYERIRTLEQDLALAKAGVA